MQSTKIVITRGGVQSVEIECDNAIEQAEAHKILEGVSFEIQALDTALKTQAAAAGERS
jgi:hypothetical protein